MSQRDTEVYDVTIIGAGLVGICCALSLSETGLSVHLIDRDEPGQAASYGNAGIISPWSIIPQAVPGIWKQIPSMLLAKDGPLSVSPTYLPKLIPWGLQFLRHATEKKVRASSDAMSLLNHTNMDLYRQHLAGTGQEHLIRDSFYVHAFRDPRKVAVTSLGYAIRSEKGCDVEQIGFDELQKLEPALSPEFKAAILLKGQARALAPGKIGTALAEKAKNNGVKISQATVTKFEGTDKDTWVVETSTGDVATKKIVLAAGAWSTQLLKPLGVKLPLEAERGYHLEYSHPEIVLNNSVMDVDKMMVASSMEDGLRVAGTAEFADVNAPPNQERIEGLKRLAKKMLPDLNEVDFKTWMGIRPSMPDSLPVLGEFASHKGLFAAFGHSHYGLMMAPKTGQLISDLVSGKPINHDLSPFRCERF